MGLRLPFERDARRRTARAAALASRQSAGAGPARPRPTRLGVAATLKGASALDRSGVPNTQIRSVSETLRVTIPNNREDRGPHRKNGGVIEVRPGGERHCLNSCRTRQLRKIARKLCSGAQPVHAGLEQVFRAEAKGLSSISIALLPAAKRKATTITVALMTVDDCLQHTALVREKSFVTSRTDGSITLRFDAIADSQDRAFAIIASSSSSRADARSTLLSSADERIPGHISCSVSGEVMQDLGLAATLGYTDPLPFRSVPGAILYSPLTQCNLNCIHCISKDTRKRTARLAASLKDAIRTWCSNGLIDFIRTDYSGDILYADERSPGELAFLISLNVPFHVDTNGVCLTAERTQSLVQSKLASLNISLDAAEEATHQRIRRGSKSLSGNSAECATVFDSPAGINRAAAD